MTQAAQPTGTGKSTIRPFRVDVPEAKLTDLRRRVEVMEWPERDLVPDGSQGVKLDTMQALDLF
jgi:hypothetical protein